MYTLSIHQYVTKCEGGGGGGGGSILRDIICGWPLRGGPKHWPAQVSYSGGRPIYISVGGLGGVGPCGKV